jgi:hypothetical protein
MALEAELGYISGCHDSALLVTKFGYFYLLTPFEKIVAKQHMLKKLLKYC